MSDFLFKRVRREYSSDEESDDDYDTLPSCVFQFNEDNEEYSLDNEESKTYNEIDEDECQIPRWIRYMPRLKTNNDNSLTSISIESSLGKTLPYAITLPNSSTESSSTTFSIPPPNIITPTSSSRPSRKKRILEDKQVLNINPSSKNVVVTEEINLSESISKTSNPLSILFGEEAEAEAPSYVKIKKSKPISSTVAEANYLLKQCEILN